MKRKLLLWDIDGTLITTQRAGRRALTRTLKVIFSIDSDLTFLDMAGRTDPYIIQQIFKQFGLTMTEKATHDFFDAYFVLLAEELKNGTGGAHPGILNVLEMARQRADIAQGLLTGNLEQGAKVKLVPYDLWKFFEFGAYGNDGATRNDLGPQALKRATKLHGVEFAPHNVFVIGDTPHDVACGKAIGAKTIAVATGGATLEELQSCGPTAALADLSDAAAFFRIIDAK